MRSFVKELLSRDGQHRVVIFRRDSGSFGFEVERYSSDPMEQCWIPHGRWSECFVDSADAAEREALARVDWLRNGLDDD